MKMTMIPIVVVALETIYKGLVKRLENLVKWRSSRLQHYYQYWKSPGDLRRLAVTQTPVENYQLKLVGKTLKEVAIITMIILPG